MSVEMTATHSPLPWALHVDRLSVFDARPDQQQVLDCNISSLNLTNGERQANAEFIVRACNSHRALLADHLLLLATLTLVLRSARPHPEQHPAIWSAWQVAHGVLDAFSDKAEAR